MPEVKLTKLQKFATAVGRKLRRDLGVEIDDNGGHWLIEYLLVEVAAQEFDGDSETAPEKKYKSVSKSLNPEPAAMTSWGMFRFLQSLSDKA